MNSSKQRLEVRIIGETNNRQSKYELQNLLIVIDDYIRIKELNAIED